MTQDRTPLPSANADGLGVRIVRGNPTDEELAAVLAVLHSLPPVPLHRPAPQPPTLTDWSRTQRPLRPELRPRWR